MHHPAKKQTLGKLVATAGKGDLGKAIKNTTLCTFVKSSIKCNVWPKAGSKLDGVFALLFFLFHVAVQRREEGSG